MDPYAPLGGSPGRSLRAELLAELRDELRTEAKAAAGERLQACERELESLRGVVRREARAHRSRIDGELGSLRTAVDQLAGQAGELGAELRVVKYYLEHSVQSMHAESSRALLASGLSLPASPPSPPSPPVTARPAVGLPPELLTELGLEVAEIQGKLAGMAAELAALKRPAAQLRDPRLSPEFTPRPREQGSKVDPGSAGASPQPEEEGENDWSRWRRVQEWWIHTREQMAELQAGLAEQAALAETFDTALASQAEHIASLRIFECDSSLAIQSAARSETRLRAAEEAVESVERVQAEEQAGLAGLRAKLEDEAARWRMDALQQLVASVHEPGRMTSEDEDWRRAAMAQIERAIERVGKQSQVSIETQTKLAETEGHVRRLERRLAELAAREPVVEAGGEPSAAVAGLIRQRNEEVSRLEGQLAQLSLQSSEQVQRLAGEVGAMQQWQAAAVEQMRLISYKSDETSLEPHSIGPLAEDLASFKQQLAGQDSRSQRELDTLRKELIQVVESNGECVADSLAAQIRGLQQQLVALQQDASQHARLQAEVDELRAELVQGAVQTDGLRLELQAAQTRLADAIEARPCSESVQRELDELRGQLAHTVDPELDLLREQVEETMESRPCTESIQMELEELRREIAAAAHQVQLEHLPEPAGLCEPEPSQFEMLMDQLPSTWLMLSALVVCLLLSNHAVIFESLRFSTTQFPSHI